MNLTKYERRPSREVRIGRVVIGGDRPIAVQSMTNTDTKDTEACIRQIERIFRAGGPIVRLTAQGRREGENLERIVRRLREEGCDAAVVADIHFVPEVAAIAAKYVDKVRINPGNYNSSHGEFEALIDRCRERGVAIRIGVNHGSLSKRVFDEWGDTPEGMVASAMEFLRVCREKAFDQVVVSMKSSNTRVMVAAYRLLAEAMEREGMDYPLHLGVTEAGNGIEGRIKSAVGIGALLADGIGDTIRVSLTEAPENEIPVAQLLVDHFARRSGVFSVKYPERYTPTRYSRRTRVQTPLIHSELPADWRVIEALTENPTAELRAAILSLDRADEPVAVCRRYEDTTVEAVAVKAAADLGSLFLDGLADGIRIDAPHLSEKEIAEIELMILQAARVRMSRTEYIACPSCGRTLYDIEGTLAAIRARTSHLKNLKIGVMGCIVNGPGEMADADYGYVGAAPGRITLYKGRTVVEKNIPQEEALDRLVALIKANGDWADPEINRNDHDDSACSLFGVGRIFRTPAVRRLRHRPRGTFCQAFGAQSGANSRFGRRDGPHGARAACQPSPYADAGCAARLFEAVAAPALDFVGVGLPGIALFRSLPLLVRAFLSAGIRFSGRLRPRTDGGAASKTECAEPPPYFGAIRRSRSRRPRSEAQTKRGPGVSCRVLFPGLFRPAAFRA